MFPRNLSETAPLPIRNLPEGALASLLNGDKKIQQGHSSISKYIIKFYYLTIIIKLLFF